MSNEKNLPYAVVCGGVNIDIGAHSFAPLRAKDSNPGKVELSLGGVGRNIAHNMRLLGVPTYLLTAVGGDSRASQVEQSCRDLGIDLSHALHVPDGRTSTYVFVGDSDGDMAIAVSDMEICKKLTPDYFASQKELLDGAAAVVVDANLPRESIAYLVEHCAAPLFVDPVSTVKADEINKAREGNVLNALAGKVAGVNISAASGTAGGGSRIIIRGQSSLGSAGSPLFVIDGMPVSNQSYDPGNAGSALSGAAVDPGNRMGDIASDDIESINVLKGAAATALYGARAKDGAVIITTKKGSKNQQTSDSINST